MTEPIKISTSKYTKQGKVDVDGNIWNIVLPGAGTELRFSQASRACKLYQARLDLLDKKIECNTATKEDLDNYETYSNKYEENEQIVYAVFQNTFKDDTNGNTDVKKWINDTPTSIIMLAFEDVKGQTNGKKSEEITSQKSS